MGSRRTRQFLNQVGEVWIEVLGAQPWLDETVTELKGSGHLHPEVKVRNLLRCLDPSATATSQPGGPRPPLPQGTRIDVSPRITEVVHDGLLLAVERRDPQNRLYQVDHYSTTLTAPPANGYRRTRRARLSTRRARSH